MNYDNICKYLAEQYPADFVRWLLAIEPSDIKLLKTELTLEPIRANAVTFLQTANRILHIEFQTLTASNSPLPLRMLDYYSSLSGCSPVGTRLKAIERLRGYLYISLETAFKE